MRPFTLSGGLEACPLLVRVVQWALEIDSEPQFGHSGLGDPWGAEPHPFASSFASFAGFGQAAESPVSVDEGVA